MIKKQPARHRTITWRHLANVNKTTNADTGARLIVQYTVHCLYETFVIRTLLKQKSLNGYSIRGTVILCVWLVRFFCAKLSRFFDRPRNYFRFILVYDAKFLRRHDDEFSPERTVNCGVAISK